MCIHVCVCVYTSKYMWVYASVWVHVCVSVWVLVCVHASVPHGNCLELPLSSLLVLLCWTLVGTGIGWGNRKKKWFLQSQKQPAFAVFFSFCRALLIWLKLLGPPSPLYHSHSSFSRNNLQLLGRVPVISPVLSACKCIQTTSCCVWSLPYASSAIADHNATQTSIHKSTYVVSTFE